ncbi:uncharacterized protein BcabD6B2_55170 [Babesia caballi]|uniref:Uncharacterized protein n=1 Tax=Babesia caballi TaxID=5871 RepID=A0AAV4M1X9_BABCB|nr:hypothetical protein, conserved [Babesia caballi]
MFWRLWIPFAVIYGLSQAGADRSRCYRNGSGVGGASLVKGCVARAFLHPAGGARQTPPCAAEPKKASKGTHKGHHKGARPPKGAVKKPPVQGRSKVTLTAEQKQKIDELYRAHIAVTDTKAYIEKLSLNTHAEETSPYLTLFESERLTRDDLVGIDMPFGLVPTDRYELWKLCGHVCDPLPVISSQSLTPNQFSQRLFGGRRELTRDEFNYRIEYKMRFYAPGYGDIFFMDKVRCWRGGLGRGGKTFQLTAAFTRCVEESLRGELFCQILRPKDEVPLSAAMLSVNYEVHRQGIHPAVLDMFWGFFTDNPDVVEREQVTSKLNWVVDRLRDLDPGEGISPDNFYKIFIEPTRRALATFDKESFVRQQLRNIHERDLRQKVLSNNKALRHRSKILTAAYLEEVRGLYKVPKPEFFKRYEQRRLVGYFNLVADMRDRQMRRRAMSRDRLRELKEARASTPKPKKKREKKPSKRNKKLGRGVAN